MATIRIENLKVSSIIGTQAHEQEKPQELIINISIESDISKAAASDLLENTVDYYQIYTDVVELTQNSRCQLLETLADKILKLILDKPLVQEAKVKINKKPQGLELAEAVSVEVSG